MDRIEYKEFVDKLKITVEQEISQVGGYWPVNSAISVVGEELGFATDCWLAGRRDQFAVYLFYSMWVMTCIANQYQSDLGKVAQREWDGNENVNNNVDPAVALLIAQSEYSKVQRIVNRYENGIYTDSKENFSIAVHIVRTHRALVQAIELVGADIGDLVDNRVALVRSYRGAPQVPKEPRFDPTVGGPISRFMAVANVTACPFAKTAKVWATKPWRSGVDANDFVKANVETFERFSRVCQPEGFDGVAVEIFGIVDLEQLTLATEELLRALGPYSDRNPMTQPISRKEWRFALFNVDVFVTVFSSIYDKDHPRHCNTGGSSFMFLQPQISFKAKAAREKNNIRKRFTEIGQDYTTFLKKVRCEGHKYVKPVDLETGIPIEWWLR